MSQRIANIADNRASFIDFTTAASKPQAGGGSEGGRVAAQTGLARQIGFALRHRNLEGIKVGFPGGRAGYVFCIG